MVVREYSGETSLNCAKIAPCYGQADIHPIRMESFEPPEASPGCEDPFIFQESQQQVFVIACKRDHGAWPFTPRKSFYHTHRTKAAVYVITQENRHRMLTRGSF